MSKNIQDYVIKKVVENIEYHDEELKSEIGNLKHEVEKLKKCMKEFDIERCCDCKDFTRDYYYCENCENIFCLACIVYGKELCYKCNDDSY
jgi:predicted RNase H-like nuclease (RuvC/YqgF family)